MLLLLGLVVGCGAEPLRMLHERRSFQGSIALKSATLSLAAELAFDRESGHCQVVQRRATTVTLGRDRGGQLFAFEDGRPRALRAREMQELRLVLALVDGNGVTAAGVRGDGYAVQLPAFGRVQVAVQEAPEPVHGRGHKR